MKLQYSIQSGAQDPHTQTIHRVFRLVYSHKWQANDAKQLDQTDVARVLWHSYGNRFGAHTSPPSPTIWQSKRRHWHWRSDKKHRLHQMALPHTPQCVISPGMEAHFWHVVVWLRAPLASVNGDRSPQKNSFQSSRMKAKRSCAGKKSISTPLHLKLLWPTSDPATGWKWLPAIACNKLHREAFATAWSSWVGQCHAVGVLCKSSFKHTAPPFCSAKLFAASAWIRAVITLPTRSVWG